MEAWHSGSHRGGGQSFPRTHNQRTHGSGAAVGTKRQKLENFDGVMDGGPKVAVNEHASHSRALEDAAA